MRNDSKTLNIYAAIADCGLLLDPGRKEMEDAYGNGMFFASCSHFFW